MTRLQLFNAEINNAIINGIKNTMPEPKMIDATFCCDFENEEFTWAWTDFKIPSGKLSLKLWIFNSQFVQCKKSEATCLLVVGEKNECGLWVSPKKIWLRNK